MLFKDAVYMQNIKCSTYPLRMVVPMMRVHRWTRACVVFPLLYHENVHQNNKWAGLMKSCLWLVKKG